MTRIRCTEVHPQEPFFTEGKEYMVFSNEVGDYCIKCDDGDIVENAETVELLLCNLQEYWLSNFELVVEDKATKYRKAIQKRIVQYNMDISKYNEQLLKGPSNILEMQIAVLNVKRAEAMEILEELKKIDKTVDNLK